MDHFATRYPTNVLDIADFLVRLACEPAMFSAHLLARVSDTRSALPATKPLPPILHYSAEEPFTKYEMCLIFSKILGLPHAHIIPDAEPYTVRPRFSPPTGLSKIDHRAKLRPPARAIAIYTRTKQKTSWKVSAGSGGTRSRNGGLRVCRRHSRSSTNTIKFPQHDPMLYK